MVPDGEIILGLDGKASKEAEASLGDLERWADEGLDHLTAQLAELEVASNPATIAKTLNAGLDSESEVGRTLAPACRNDAEILERVHRFAPVVRTDAGGMAQVFLPGDIYVTETSSKRDSGTAYTPRSLAEEVAKHTLDPLIYEPGPHNENDDTTWQIRPPDEILDLKVCDPAVGSAAILVAAARYLAESLIQSRIEHGDLPIDALDSATSDEEALDIRVEARRDVVSNCVYGVDRDPMAAEMAKLSLWLVTMAKDRPFTFLDHAIKVGDSLLGITSIRQLRYLHMEPEQFAKDGALPVELGADRWWDTIDADLSRVESIRERLRLIRVSDIEDAQRKADLLNQADDASETLVAAADALVATGLSSASLNRKETDALFGDLAKRVGSIETDDDLVNLRSWTMQVAERGNPNKTIRRRFLHWPLAFPEVFHDRKGFDAVVGNPPWVGTKRLASSIGSDLRAYCVRYIAGQSGQVDLATYFLLRSAQVSSTLGLLLTRKVVEGDDIPVGLGSLREQGWEIYWATTPSKWPNPRISARYVAVVLLQGAVAVSSLDGVPDHGAISARLTRTQTLDGPLVPLSTNRRSPIAFLGVNLNDDGGLRLPALEALELLDEDPERAAVLKPYVTSEVVGRSPSYEVSEYAIDLSGFSEAEARSRFPTLMKLAERTREHRSKLPASKQRVRDEWWQPEARAAELKGVLAGRAKPVPVIAETARALVPALLHPNLAFSKAVFVFVTDHPMSTYGFLVSTHHQIYIAEFGATLSGDPRYGKKRLYLPGPYPRHEILGMMEPATEFDREIRALMTTKSLGLSQAMNHVASSSDSQAKQLRLVQQRIDAAVEQHLSSVGGKAARSLEYSERQTQAGPRWWPHDQYAETVDLLVRANYALAAEERGVSFQQILSETGNA